MDSLILCEGLAGLQSQALGLTEAAGLQARVATLVPRTPWRFVAARVWPAPLAAVGLDVPAEKLIVTCGGTGGAVGATLRRAGRLVVQVQNPRMDLRKFDLVVANRHDRIAGPQRNRHPHGPAPGDAGAAGGGAGGMGAPPRASAPPFGRRAGRRQQWPLPAGSGGWAPPWLPN